MYSCFTFKQDLFQLLVVALNWYRIKDTKAVILGRTKLSNDPCQKNFQSLKIGLTCTGTEANVISSCIWWKKHLPPEQLPSHENHVYTIISASWAF